MEAVKYNNYTSSGYFLDINVRHDIIMLHRFLNNLKSNNQKLVCLHAEGAIIEQLDSVFDKEAINHRMLELEKIEKNKSENVGESFYLLWEFLPEKLKKELKIYIKKQE